MQAGNQGIDVARRLIGGVLSGCRFHGCQHGFEHVDGCEGGVAEGACQLQLPLAGHIQQVFGGMGQFVGIGQVEKAGHALDGMEGAEDFVERLGVLGIVFQLQQGGLGVFNVFLGFVDKVNNQRQIVFGECNGGCDRLGGGGGSRSGLGLGTGLGCRGRCSRFSLCRGQAFKRADHGGQLGRRLIGAGLRGRCFQTGQHAFEHVHGCQCRIAGVADEFELSLAGHIQQIFRRMGQFIDIGQVQKACRSFHSVKCPKNTIESFFIFGMMFDFQQGGFGVFEVFARFVDEIHNQRQVLFAQ